MPTPARLRVLHIVPDLGVGGLPRVAETLCRATDPARFDVRVLCLNFLGEIAQQLRSDGYAVYDLPRDGVDGPDRFASRRVAALYRRERIDVVHTHNTQAFMHGGVAAMLAPGRRLIHTDHARAFPDRLRYYVIERILSTVAHRVVGVSEHTTENLHRYEWIPRRKLLTIPNGIESRLFEGDVDRNALRASLGVPLDAELLLLGARLEEQKGITYLLKAMARLLPARARLHFAVAGEGSLRESLEAEAVALGIRAHVHFVGVRLDMPKLLRAADLFVLPSNWEGLPMIVLEALAARCPIVATSVGGVPSAVRDGDTGYLVPPQDPGQLAQALARALDEPEERARRAQRGRALFDQAFSAEAMARRYESLYLGGD
ncbi:MAG: glycosyltransferase [Gemmatimonadaceae bacterium]